MQIEPVATSDVPAVLQLLQQSQLPVGDYADHVATALLVRQDNAVVGSVALEVYGEAALLRSVAVAPHLRGQGLGVQLTEAAFDLARKLRVSTLYLLTETAADFFTRCGFVPVERSAVAPAVQQSVEFHSVCPQSAQAMVLYFRREHSQ